MAKQYKVVHCTVNGKEIEQVVDVRSSLTDMLRNDLHLTSVKKGCEVGECGACTVIINGEGFNSCIEEPGLPEQKQIHRFIVRLSGTVVKIHGAVHEHDEH